MDHISYFGYGLWHSLYGIVKFWSLEPVSKVALSAAANGQQLTVLQRRRLEKRKQEELEQGAANSKQPPSSFTRSPRRLYCQCVLWNGIIFAVSIAAFQGLLLPLVGWLVEKVVETPETSFLMVIYKFLEFAFDCLWLLPLFLIGKIVNAIWYQDLADVVYYQKRSGVVSYTGMGQTFANLLFGLIIQTIVLIQAWLFSLVPFLGWPISLVHHALLCSFYCFDYRWTSEGRRMTDRIAQLERHWPYYCGFGLLLAIVFVEIESIFLRGCVFSLLFPVFIVSSMVCNLPTIISPQTNQPTVVIFSEIPVLTPAARLTDIAFRKFITKAKTSAQKQHHQHTGSSQGSSSTSGSDQTPR